MILEKQKYNPGWQYVRDTLTIYNISVADFCSSIGIASGMFYYYAKEKHNPNLFIFVSMCQGLSKINGVAWHEIARKIVENDYKRGDKL